MRDRFEPLALDPAAAYRGVLGSIEEQLEKVNLGGTGEAESRYARRTLADMRQNLAGGRAIVDALAPWLEANEGQAILQAIREGFDRLEAAYDRTEGPALPTIPEGWPRRIRPSEAQITTPFGQLWLAVRADGPGRPRQPAERHGRWRRAPRHRRAAAGPRGAGATARVNRICSATPRGAR